MTTSSRSASAERLQHLVEQRDQRLAALQREPLLARRTWSAGTSRTPRPRCSRLRMCFCSSGSGLVYLRLDPVLDPAPLLRVLDVHVLDADPAAVGVAQHAEHVAQLHLLLAGEAADREHAVEVPQRQAVLEHVQVGVPADLELERVGVGHQVTAHPVRVDQLDHPGGLVDLPLGGARRRAPSAPARTGSAAR